MEHQTKRLPKFLINPNFRLHFPYFNVEWYAVEDSILRQETLCTHPNRQVYQTRKLCVICINRADNSAIDIIYSDPTNFENLQLQKWLRKTIRDQITLRAKVVLPNRLHELETKHHLKANGVVVEKLKGNCMGLCTYDNIIHLVPYLIIMPPAFMDDTILHEMAHIKHKHHRKSFWNFLSILLGRDSKEEKQLQDTILSKYLTQIKFLMR